MGMPGRRKFLRRSTALIALAHLPAAPLPALMAGPGDDAVAGALRTFLKHAYVTVPMQCGARLGDGVPPHTEVEAFLSLARSLARESPERLLAHLLAATKADLEADAIMVVDGWVFARTEAVAASAYILVTGRNCRLAPDNSQ